MGFYVTYYFFIIITSSSSFIATYLLYILAILGAVLGYLQKTFHSFYSLGSSCLRGIAPMLNRRKENVTNIEWTWNEIDKARLNMYIMHTSSLSPFPPSYRCAKQWQGTDFLGPSRNSLKTDYFFSCCQRHIIKGISRMPSGAELRSMARKFWGSVTRSDPLFIKDFVTEGLLRRCCSRPSLFYQL